MPEQLTILPVKTSVQLVADGSRTEFTFPFCIFAASDLEVYIDDKKTNGSLEVNGIGNSNGGSVVFAQAPAAAAVITIRRNLPIERLTDFQESSELRAAALNNELDYLTACVQQINDDLSRCLGLEPTDYSASLALPPKSSRSDKLLGFDADGNVIAVVPSGNSEANGWKNLDDIPVGTEFQHFTTPEKSKLETVQLFASPNPPQVSAQEKTSAIESELRSHSPRDIRDMVQTLAPAAPVATVFGRTGTITALAGDYAADQITDTAAKVVMTVSERSKLTGIQAGAQVNAPQVSATEKTAGSETQLRSHSPRDIRDMVQSHAPPIVATVAQLKALTGMTDGQRVFVRGWSSAGDGRGGVFVWRASDARQKAVSATVAAGGTGYAVNMIINTTTGTGIAAAFNVASVSGGAVTAVTVRRAGIFSTVPANGAATSCDPGATGCTLNYTWGDFEDGGTVIASDAGGTGRWVRQFDDLANVKWFGAIGDGVTDDTAAIQAAVNSTHRLFVPKGDYLVSAAITWDPLARGLTLVGEDDLTGNTGSRIVGTLGMGEEPIFHRDGRYMKADGTYVNLDGRDPGNTIGNGVVLDKMRFQPAATNTVGAGFEIQGCKKSYISNCYFQSPFRGLTIGQSNFDTTVINCYFGSTYNNVYTWPTDAATSRKAWGLYASGHKFLYGLAANGCGTGIYLVGAGNSLQGARIEQCNYGLILGDTEYNVTGSAAGSVSRSMISGVSYEACAIGVYGAGATAYTTLAGVNGQGSTGAYGRPASEVGVWIARAGTALSLLSIGTGGTLTRGDIINETDVPLLLSDGSVSGGGGGKFAGGWNALSKFLTVPPKFSFLRSPVFGLAVNARHKTMTAFHDLMLPGLTGLNCHNLASSGTAQGGPVFSKNLGGSVTPANGASTAAVTFWPASDLAAANAGFSVAPTASDGAGTLTPDTYWYAVTWVGPNGETGVAATWAGSETANRSVVVGAPNDTVTMSFYGTLATNKRRIYRYKGATAPTGSYDGYYEIAGNVTSFTDTGAAFTAAGGKPPINASIWSRAEDDANYQIVATPSWSTTVWIAGKATTGFTLNFGTPAPDANQTVNWLLFRG